MNCGEMAGDRLTGTAIGFRASREHHRVFTRSNKRPANFQQMYSKIHVLIAGRLLDRVNTLLA